MDLWNLVISAKISKGEGGSEAEDGLIMKTISGEYENDRVTSIGQSAFMKCASLEEVSFPNVTLIDKSAFYSCTGLKKVAFSNAKTVSQGAFQGCKSLMTAIFLGSSVATLGASAFYQTPMVSSGLTGSFGSIYVPASLVDSYKSASLWSLMSSRITSYVE